MKLFALEEHFATPAVVEAWRSVDAPWADPALAHSSEGETGRRLLDLGADRLAAMDASGVDVQVVSLTTPGLQNLPPEVAVRLQGPSNDTLAEAVRRHPGRLRGFATLATPAPREAARELERAVKTLGLDGAMLFGRTRDRPLDHPDCWQILEVASELRAPLYLHPQSPLPAVREALYGGLGEALSGAFATHGLGWHYEAGVQLVRLVLAGVFDRFPGLRLIAGHWGEVVLFYLDRIDSLQQAAKLPRRPSEVLRDHLHVTPSGIFSPRYLRWAIEVLGVERVLFAVDYPFVQAAGGAARAFLEGVPLEAADRERIAHGNWERLLADIRR